MSNDYLDRLEKLEVTQDRQARKLSRIDKRMQLFDKHKTEKVMDECYSAVREMKNHFQLLFTKLTIYEQLMWFIQDNDTKATILWNVMKKFDDDDRFWQRADEMSLEELERVFKS
jgi:hypothetical protein